MMKITFLTGHHATSKRKTGFHFWAEDATDRGHDVRWVTVGKSHISRLKKSNGPNETPDNKWIFIKDRLSAFDWVPLFHPINLGSFTNTLLPLFNLYPRFMPAVLLEGLKDTDIFIVETGAGLMLVPRLSELFPAARFVYFSSDRLDTLKAHPAIYQAEKKALPYFSLIRVISEERLRDYPSISEVRYIPQGIDRALFDREYQNPYPSSKNIIALGDMLFDEKTVSSMAQNFPDWHFHLFGKRARISQNLPNVREYGECDFSSIVPYIKHADIGLAPYRAAPGGNYFAQSSLKIAQYSYCRLPTLIPHDIPSRQAHHIAYQRDDTGSIRQALAAAVLFDRSLIHPHIIPDWKDVLDSLLSFPEGKNHAPQ